MLGATTVSAQVKPNSDWRTLTTPRFYIHYTPELEDLARRAAAEAESAYVALSRYLKPPRGRIDLVIADHVDFANGYATPAPSNRIGIYANPPVFESSLRSTDDFARLVITHELAHVFHLDRVGGIWAPLQRVFGRYPLFFPNLFHPRWLVEGLAVYYESRITGSGRILGSEHRMIARAASLADEFPRIDQLSLANPHFPYGISVYAYGSLFMDYLARSHGDSAMRRFVDASSGRLLWWTLNGPAKRAFGRSLTSAYRAWADSINRAADASPWTDPLPGWRELTVDGAFANYPRWLSDSAIVYVGTGGRESFGAYQVTVTPSNVERGTGRLRERIARRHTRSPNVKLADGSLLYSELEYTSLHEIRSDLYVDRVRGGTTRLTYGARLALPDARDDGLIVAVQTIPAGTRLALVSPNGRGVTPITGGGPDEQWTEPSWSPDGRRIVASRWTRGGTNEIVVVDTAGRVEHTLVRERAVASTPSWSPDGRFVYFTSDRDGTPNVYRAAVADAPALERVSDARTGLLEAQLSPSGREIAAVVFKSDGYHVGVAPLDSSTTFTRAPDLASAAHRPPPTVNRHQGPSRPYSPWRQLLPRYWMPISEVALDSNSARYGFLTSGSDIVGRHEYDGAILVPTDGSGLTGAFNYRNASSGWPVDVSYSQDWENRGVVTDAADGDAIIGTFRRRIRDAGIAINFPRPRMRTFSYVSVGAGYEARDYATAPAAVMDRIDSLYRRTYYYPRISASTGWSNAQTPVAAISQEDGLSVATTVRWRWRSSPRPLADSTLSPSDPGASTRTMTTSAVATASAYKSLDLPGFAHHVVALRGATGVQDNRGTAYFEVGGSSGGVVDVLPGYFLGEGRRTFGVRGFEAATLVGIRAYQASAEYRAPLRMPGRGLGTLPLFFERSSITLFGDAGTAWCPGTFAARPAPATSLCTAPDIDAGVLQTPEVIASAGAELNVTAAVLTWDAPFRWRLGYAVPLVVPAGYRKPNPSAYLAIGVSF